MHCNVAVQVAIAVLREVNLAKDSRIAVESVGPAPQGETSLLLHPATPQAAEQMMRELAMQDFPQNHAMLQRVLQILRMCLSR